MTNNNKRKLSQALDDDDELACMRFFTERRHPKEPLPVPFRPGHAHVIRKPEARVRLEFELYASFHFAHLNGIQDMRLNLGSPCEHFGPYNGVLRASDRREGVHIGRSELMPFLALEAQSALRAQQGPWRYARSLWQSEKDAALVQTSWILRSMQRVPDGEPFLKTAVFFTERAAMTLARIAFVMRERALALAQHMGELGEALRADARNLAGVRAEHPLQPLARRARVEYLSPHFLPLERKSAARIAFEDEVMAVFDWRVAMAEASMVCSNQSEVMVSLTGAHALPCSVVEEESHMPGAVNLARLEWLLVREGRTLDAVVGALMAARGFEAASHALMRAVQRFRLE